MRVLKFCVDEQKISKMPGCDFSNIARGSSDYLKVQLSVSDGWSGCAKVAEFYDMLGQHYESGWEEGDKIVQTWTLTDDPVYPEPELSAEEALNIIMGVVQ